VRKDAKKKLREREGKKGKKGKRKDGPEVGVDVLLEVLEVAVGMRQLLLERLDGLLEALDGHIGAGLLGLFWLAGARGEGGGGSWFRAKALKLGRQGPLPHRGHHERVRR